MSKVIGIDLGTSKCCVCVLQDGRPTVLVNSEGGRTTSSVVSFLDDGSIIVGDAAKSKAVMNAEYTATNVKRLMGKRWFDIEVANTISNIQYKIARDAEDKVLINGRNKFYSPQEISSMLLKKMKRTAEKHLGEKVEDAVITVPAYFNDAQRQATREAGKLAGLNVRRIINEPTAAALAYGLNRHFPIYQHYIAVFDLGGGTFDISILQPGEGVFEVLSTNGDSHLGGNDFDFLIMNWLIDEFQKDEQIDLRRDPTACQRLKEAAEKAKVELSSSNETEIRIDYIKSDGQVSKHINKVFTKAQFEKLADPIFEKIKIKCEEAIKMANVSPSKINEIIMVGESCRIPKVSELIRNIFDRRPIFGVNLMEGVAIGAAIQGAVLNGDVKDILLLDVVPLGLGIEVGDSMNFLIKANTTIPAKNSEVFTTTSDNQTSVEVHILQGNSPRAKENISLGKFIFEDIKPAPKGISQIEVTFDIDANGVLHVSAKDVNTGNQKKVRIEHKFN